MRPAMGDTVVLNPGLGVGHLVPMVELAKLFLRGGLAATVIVNGPPGKATDTSAAVARAAAANPSVRFHVLPAPPDVDAGGTTPPDAAAQAPNPFVLLRRMNAPLRDYLRSVLPSVRALVLDMLCFCADAIDVAAELGVPAYVFYTGSASSLAVNLYLPRMQAEIGDASLGEIGDAPLSFPGNRPFKPTDLPELALDRHNEVYKSFLHAFQRMPESRGIVVNTFEWLETTALRAIRDGACVPGRAMPPVYCVGPMVSAAGGGEKKHECLAWLDAQPEKSVVFLCFGSMGTFPVKQLEEIAVGLEWSGQRFLWVVQSPRTDGGPDLLADAPVEPDLAALLPEGFLERTGGRGFVVKSWVPQANVLRHRATGAFVTHCGWNSTLEAIVAGLPLICWPLYAEQRQNKVFVVEEMGAGVEMVGYDEEVVAAAEVEAKVRWVMESKGGAALRERAMAAKDKALEALDEGGASRTAFAEFLRDL
ncbi:anthocyanidin 5,3-O-glucosyltransferase-like [Hordeum vulgare]|nr:anthocyanidin 5,3-O-glucosyltransferase-like [Hordeum vulgare]